jgi:aquaporin Z
VGVYVGDWAMMQMWVFWLAPLVGALAGALIYKTISTEEE